MEFIVNLIKTQDKIMKCDTCTHMASQMATMDDPYPSIWCCKGHWEGVDVTYPDDPHPDRDPWANCGDYQERINTAEAQA